uniref:(northern house mosquito) hypothetical protein n=1 Tax=Culex pipiens TaxID=7175 RepID=A0A8D8AWH6_CULPI
MAAVYGVSSASSGAPAGPTGGGVIPFIAPASFRLLLCCSTRALKLTPVCCCCCRCSGAVAATATATAALLASTCPTRSTRYTLSSTTGYRIRHRPGSSKGDDCFFGPPIL